MKKLIACAKELNEVLGLSPAIKLVGVKKDELVSKIKEGVELLDPEEDELSDETVETLKGLGFWPGDEVEEGVEEEAEGEDAEDEDDEDEPAPPKKKSGKAEKSTKPEKAEKPAKPEKEKKEKAPKVKKERSASAYGTAVELMCANTNMSLADLIAAVKAKGLNVDAGKSAITTAYSAVKKISGLLAAHGWKKK